MEPRDHERDPRPGHNQCPWGKNMIPDENRSELGFWHRERGRLGREKSRDMGRREDANGFRVFLRGRLRERE